VGCEDDRGLDLAPMAERIVAASSARPPVAVESGLLLGNWTAAVAMPRASSRARNGSKIQGVCIAPWTGKTVGFMRALR